MRGVGVGVGAVWAIAAAWLLVSAGGCDGTAGAPRHVPLFKAAGRVLVKGQPAAGAHVRLHPQDQAQAKAGLYPQATTDTDGKFELTTYSRGDGAPAGLYQVTVTWPNEGHRPRSGAEREALLEGAEKPDKLGRRYADPQKSGLSARIGTQPDQQLPPIELP